MLKRRKPENPGSYQDVAAAALADQIYHEMLAVMGELTQLHVEDYDLPLLKDQMVLPVAQYLSQDRPSTNGKTSRQVLPQKRPDNQLPFVKPLFVSGEPGIGKTTLLMVLDEALFRLQLPGRGSCRDLVGSGEVSGYFAEKGTLPVTPLSLFGRPTAALSARDWNNVFRHWTYDETASRQSELAVTDFVQHMRGKVVIVDEAEMEGYVYFSELLAKSSILVILSSNLDKEHIRLAQDRVRTVELKGLDHRSGEITNVILPDAPHELFDLFPARGRVKAPSLAGALIAETELHQTHLVYLDWADLQNRPLMKDDFARFFRDIRADFVLLDGVPFFSDITVDEVNLTFLGYLSRFVNFVDAIHDCHLPLLVRSTQAGTLESAGAGQTLRAALYAYDVRVGGYYGRAAWIEWTRCLSRLRSREEFNNQVWTVISHEL